MGTSQRTGSNGDQSAYWEQWGPVSILGAMGTSQHSGSNGDQSAYWEQWGPVTVLGAMGTSQHTLGSFKPKLTRFYHHAISQVSQFRF
jgi:hypothetical protein